MSKPEESVSIGRPEVVDHSRFSRGTSGHDMSLSPTAGSMAPSLDSTIYETPFTSLSGFDVYLSANEDLPSRKSSMDIISDKQDKNKPEDDEEKKDDEISDDVTPTQTNVVQAEMSPMKLPRQDSLKEKEPKGKGGERIGDTGKCTPKKTLPHSPKQNNVKPTTETKLVMDTRSVSKDAIHEKSPNGSVKTPNSSEEIKLFKKGILGGTRALLIQKVGI